jgi:hypothetical protein
VVWRRSILLPQFIEGFKARFTLAVELQVDQSADDLDTDLARKPSEPTGDLFSVGLIQAPLEQKQNW